MPKFENSGYTNIPKVNEKVSKVRQTLRGVAPEGGILVPRTLRYAEKGVTKAQISRVESAESTPTLGRKLKRGDVEAQKAAQLMDRIQEVIAGSGSSEQISAALSALGIEDAEQVQNGKKHENAPSINESIQLIRVSEEALEEIRSSFVLMNSALGEIVGIQGFLDSVGNKEMEDFKSDQMELFSQVQTVLARFALRYFELSKTKKQADNLESGFLKLCNKFGLESRFDFLAKKAMEKVIVEKAVA